MTDDWGNAIAVDTAEYAYVTGQTRSRNFPVTIGASQVSHAGGASDAFVSKISLAGNSLVYSTLLVAAG